MNQKSKISRALLLTDFVRVYRKHHRDSGILKPALDVGDVSDDSLLTLLEACEVEADLEGEVLLRRLLEFNPEERKLMWSAGWRIDLLYRYWRDAAWH